MEVKMEEKQKPEPNNDKENKENQFLINTAGVISPKIEKENINDKDKLPTKIRRLKQNKTFIYILMFSCLAILLWMVIYLYKNVEAIKDNPCDICERTNNITCPRRITYIGSGGQLITIEPIRVENITNYVSG